MNINYKNIPNECLDRKKLLTDKNNNLMNKRLLFSAVLAAMIGANEAQAYHPMAIPAQVFAQTESGGG